MSAQKFGMVLVFRGIETKEQAEMLAEWLRKRGIVDEAESSRVHGFNPEHGGPVWYVP